MTAGARQRPTRARTGGAARRHREAGGSPVLALMVLAVLSLLAAIVLTGRFAVAGGERAGAQAAADAAALAGAQEIVENIPDQLSPGFLVPSDIPILLGGGVCVQTGRVSATRLAQQNGATLTSYCYNVFRDEVSTSVRMLGTQMEGPAEADAVAATTFDAAGCRLDDDFSVPTPPPPPPTRTPTPTPPPDDDEEVPPPPPPPPPPPTRVGTSIDCGTGALALTFQIASARFTFLDLATELADIRPRLTR